MFKFLKKDKKDKHKLQTIDQYEIGKQIGK